MVEELEKKENKCEYCEKTLSTKYRLLEHKTICKAKQKYETNNEIEKMKKQVDEMRQYYEERLMLYMNENESLKKQIQYLEKENKDELRITDEWLRDNVQYLSIEHIKLGPIGYASYLLDYPLKNKVICTDIARKKFKYLNEKREWIIDPELLSLSSTIFPIIKERHRQISSQYIQKLSNDLSDISDINLLSQRMEIARIFSDNERNLFKMLEGERNQYYHDIIRHLALKL